MPMLDKHNSQKDRKSIYDQIDLLVRQPWIEVETPDTRRTSSQAQPFKQEEHNAVCDLRHFGCFNTSLRVKKVAVVQ